MEGTEHEKTFFFRHKILVINLLLMAIIVGVDPEMHLRLPDNPAVDYYIGVFILFALFLEFAGIYYKSLVIFSFHSALYQKVPGILGWSFVPRVLISGVVASLAVDTMGGFAYSEFFLIPIVVYASFKEFWVRSVLFNTERERGPRPNALRTALADILLFFYIVTAYFAIWKVYFLESPRVMFLVMSPINWGFAALAFFIVLFAFEMPLLWEDHLKPKTKLQKRMAYLSLLLPVIGLLARFYLQSFMRS